MKYSKTLLQRDRPQAMYDSEVHNYISEVTRSGENFANEPDILFSDFKRVFHQWIQDSQLNVVKGLSVFPKRDIILGVTHYLDDLHLTTKNIVVLENEYRYHWRLFGESLNIKSPSQLKPGDNLIVSLPFPYYGDIHPEIESIMNICNEKNIFIHIDACWLGCCRGIEFDFDQPCIQSVGFSLSKSLGLGANRIGVRYSRNRWNGPVSLMNDFNMINQVSVWMGLKFIKRFGSDFWQKKYHKAYNQVCRDFDLKPTKAIHLAWDEHGPVGVRPLLRILMK